MPTLDLTQRPQPKEHAEYFGLYVGKVPDGNILETMTRQLDEIQCTFGSIPESDAIVLHAPYTWTIKQVLGHLIDVERVFGYRALRFAAADERGILGMDQDDWVANTDYETPTLNSLVEELKLCRQANLCFFKRIADPAWERTAAADGNDMSVRALAWCLVGHVNHHAAIVKTRIEK